MKCKAKELYVVIILLNVFFSSFAYGGMVSKVEDNKYLYDYANIVKQNSELIEKFLKDYYDKTGIEFIILTINNLDGLNIDEYSSQIFNEWKIGMKNEGKGILLLISKDDRLIKFKISYKLEDVIKYEFCEKIVEKQIVPYIDQGQLYIGIQGAIEGVINETWSKIDKGILEIKKEGDVVGRKENINEEVVSEIGGYERYLEMLGEKPRSATDKIVFLHKEQRSYFAGQDTPEQAMIVFTQILENKITDPFLDIYTDGTNIKKIDVDIQN